MASQITDPKDFAQHINENMLADFLQSQNPPITFEIKEDKTDTKKKTRVNQEVVENFIKTIEKFEDRKKEIFGEMLYINTLSSEKHISNLLRMAIEEGIKFNAPDYDMCSCHDERALWWYIHHRDIFDKYFEKADTENLAGLKEIIIKDENIVEVEKINEKIKLEKFGEGVAKIFENTLRGKRFKVSPFTEKEYILVRVYLENLPSNQIIFNEKDDDIKRTPAIRSLFSIVMIYNPKEKTLGIRTASPKENVPEIGELFCKLFLNCSFKDTTERIYNVENKGSVRTLDIKPEPEGNIQQCYLKAVEYSLRGDSTKTIRLDIGGKENYSGTEAMENYIQKVGITEEDWIPKRFEIKFIFRREDNIKGRKRQITTAITKNGANLKNTPEDQTIREFLKTRGFIS